MHNREEYIIRHALHFMLNRLDRANEAYRYEPEADRADLTMVDGRVDLPVKREELIGLLGT